MHKLLLTKILDRAKLGRDFLSPKFSTWNEMRNQLSVYIPLDDVETRLKEKDSRHPVHVVVPEMFGILDTMLTFLSSVFWRHPLFKYFGVEEEDAVKALMLQELVSMQSFSRHTQVPLALKTLWRDALVFGIGIASPTFTRVYGKTRTMEKYIDNNGLLNNNSNTTSYKKGVVFEGNKLEIIDPYMYLPDPSVSVETPNMGEFTGWVAEYSRFALLRTEYQSKSKYLFNAKYLNDIDSRTSQYGRRMNTQNNYLDNIGINGVTDLYDSNSIDVVHMYVDLIPEEWEISNKTTPERWLFSVAADQIIIQMEPIKLAHDEVPVCVTAPETDGHGRIPISRLEVTWGLQEHANFLHNSRIENVVRSINSMFLVDPSIVNIYDFEDPEGGLFVRLLENAWGTGKIRDAVQQLEVRDITANNIMDTHNVIQTMRSVVGALDPMQGISRKSGDRVTATEFSRTFTSGTSRFVQLAKTIYYQAHVPIAWQFAHNLIQYMSKGWSIEAVQGILELDNTYDKDQKILVLPEDIQIDFDLVAYDLDTPGSDDPESWMRLYDIATRDPNLQGAINFREVFVHIAKMLGAKDIKNFMNVVNNTQVQSMPNEEVANEVQKGNMVPIT